MSWLLRDFGDHLAYFPNESPDYSRAPDNFTIKLHINGHFETNPKNYVDGQVRYVDNCDVDQMSILEIFSMLNEAGELSLGQIFYKRPCSDMDLGLFPLVSDSDVVAMCGHIDTSRVIYVYSDSKPLESQESVDYVPTANWLNFDYLDPKTAEFEKEQLKKCLELEGINTDHIEDLVEKAVEVHDEADNDVNEDNEQSEVGSFHDDSSNVDSTDEEVCALKEKRKLDKEKVADVGGEMFWNGVDGWTDWMNDGDGNEQVLSDLSDCDDSDVERWAANSTDDDDEELSYPAFNDQTDMADPKFDVGMVFSSAASFRNAVRTQSILQRRPVKQLRNFGKRVKFVCGGKGCKWCIYASPMPKSTSYQVKTYSRKHTCLETFKQANITARWIAQYYENDIRMNPTWPIPALQKKVVNDWRCDVSVHIVGRAKRMALGHIKGDHKLQYGLLWDYINELKKVMPDSTVEMVLEDATPGEERRRFKRIYVCLGPVKRGFKAGCRPIIGLDGCHLKGPYGGQLLAAVGTDSNDGMYPIAWAVVEAENTDAWNWFLQLLADDVAIQNSGAWTFISDRQKGLINALMNVVPNAEHRFCVMHLYNNMKKVHKGRGLMSLLWLAAKATTEYTFNQHMEALKKLSKKAYDWLMEKPRSQWTRSAFSKTCMSDMFVNNHCEVFNNSIANFRDLPVIGLLQGIHKAVMKRIQVRRDKMLHTYQLNPICPNAMRKVSKAVKYSGGVMVQWSGASKYLCTMTDGGHEIVVDLDNKSCACRKFDLTGLPCYHACACIKWKNLPLVSFIHKTYEKDMFLKTYAHTVEPINSEQYWEKMPFPGPLPPHIKIQPGRPKKKRNKKNDVVPGDMVEEQTKLKRHNTTVICSYCGESKHNARTCPAKKHDKIVEGGEPHGSVGGSKTGGKAKKNPLPKKHKKSVEAAREVARDSVINDVGGAGGLPFIPTASPGQSQGGVFTSLSQPALVENAPLGIQPCQGKFKGKQITGLRQIEAARHARKTSIVKQPLWKL